jgi:hypothetical protein
VGNEVKIKVTADQKNAKLDVPREELAKLRGETKAMQEAVAKLAAARERQEAAAAKANEAEEKLSRTLAEGRSITDSSVSSQTERTNELRASAAAARSAAEAEEKLKKVHEDNKNEPEEKKKGFDLDFSKSFLSSGQVLGWAKSTGTQAGALLGGALVAGASGVAAAGLFVGIAAAAQSQNQQVAAAYKTLWDQVKAGAVDASSVLATDFIKSAESLGRTFNTLKPELTAGFTAAKPVIADVMDGIDRGARTIMPGLVTATKAAGDASNGLADMMESAGRGVTNFFTESAQGAAAGGDAFRSFGVIVERLGSFGGRMIAELANNSVNLFPRIESTVNAAAGAVENLAHVALPGLASGAGLALSGMTLLLNLASSLISALGPLAPAIGTFATSLKLVDMVSFGGVSKSWDSLKTSIGDAEGFTGKAKAGFSSLMTGLGPLALVTAGVGIVMDDLSKKEQRAAAAAAQHAKNVDGLADALRKSNGVIDTGVRAAAATALSNTKVADTGKDILTFASQAKVNLGQLTDAYLGNKGAQDQIIAGLDAQIARGTTLKKVSEGAPMVPVMSEEAYAAQQLKGALLDTNSVYGQAVDRNRALAGAAGESTVAVSRLATEFGTLSSKASSAEQQAAALMKIMDTMAGRKPDVEAATKSWEEMIDKFNKKDMGFEDKAAGTKKYVQSLIDANCQIRLTTEDGRKLYDTVRQGEQDFEQTAVAMKASGASTDEIRNKLQGMRDQFITSAQAMGFTAQQAQALADKYGLVPGNVATIVTSNLSPEIQKAIELGGTILRLPDGSFEVIANTSAAQGQITKFIQTNDGRSITIHVNTVNPNAAQLNVSNGSFSRLKAAGGATAYAAQGGARTGPITVNERGRQEGFTDPGGDTFLLPMGGQVIPNANMQALADQQAFRRRTGGVVAVQWIGGPSDDLGAAIWEYLKRNVRIVGGGDVQAALGQGGQVAA